MQLIMDRALKERITGAIVLVLFAVLVVPVFLDGPSDEAAVVQAVVALPGQNGQERKTQKIVLDRDRSEPVPAAGPQREELPPAVAEAPPLVPAEKPANKAAAPEKGEARQSVTGMWAVQLGSFSNQDNAEKLAAELRAQGYAAFLSQLKTSDGSLHRVRVGPQKDRDSAESVAARLGVAGHAGQVVPHP